MTLTRVDGEDHPLPPGYGEIWMADFGSDREVDIEGQSLKYAIPGLQFFTSYHTADRRVTGYFYIPEGHNLLP